MLVFMLSIVYRNKSRFQTLKILLPHVGLTLLLLTYIGVGAFIFQWLEGSKELERRREKLLDVMRIYRMIFNETNVMCNEDIRLNSTQVKRGEGKGREVLTGGARHVTPRL